MIFFFVVLAGAANLIGGFLNEYWSYLVFRTLAGAGEMGCVMVTFTLSIELVGAKQQAFVGNMNQLVFAIGEIIVRELKLNFKSHNLSFFFSPVAWLTSFGIGGRFTT